MARLSRRLAVRIAVVVLALAVISWGTRAALLRRSARFRSLADYHAGQIAGIEPIYGGTDGAETMFYHRGVPLTTQEAARYHWHWKLSAKYAAAASRPWLPVASDGPEP